MQDLVSGSEEVLGVLFIVCSQIEGNGGICLRSGGIAGEYIVLMILILFELEIEIIIPSLCFDKITCNEISALGTA